MGKLETFLGRAGGRRPAVIVAGALVVAAVTGCAGAHREQQTSRTTVGAPDGSSQPPVTRAPGDALGYPDPSSTGVAPDVDLTPYTGPCLITEPGTVIDSKAVTCALTINAPNVSIVNSTIVAPADSVVTFNSTMGAITDTDVDCGAQAGSNAINGSGYTARRVHLHNCENGINGHGNYTISDSLIDQLRASGDPHYDGIQNDGDASNVVIRHNTIVAPSDQTSAVMNDNCFGPLSNVVVDGNRLAGGGYTIYVDGSFGPGQSVCSGGGHVAVTITNNRFGAKAFGFALIRGDATVTESGNVDDATGAPIAL